MVTRARLSQDRSRLRREALLAAAVEVFAEGGSRAVTHRAVAARAGLPSATTTYYFDSIEQLLNEALISVVASWAVEIDDLLSTPRDEPLLLDDAITLFAELLVARGTDEPALQLAVYLAAVRDPELHATASALIDVLEQLSGSLLKSIGLEGRSDLHRAITATVVGLGTLRIANLQTHDEEVEYLRYSIRALLVNALMPAEEQTERINAVPYSPSPASGTDHP
ncbi:hypothetical protein BH09ACT10_BH09ACT10_24440 [soil metagenome]